MPHGSTSHGCISGIRTCCTRAHRNVRQRLQDAQRWIDEMVCCGGKSAFVRQLFRYVPDLPHGIPFDAKHAATRDFAMAGLVLSDGKIW
jgi:hypothetical protein